AVDECTALQLDEGILQSGWPDTTHHLGRVVHTAIDLTTFPLADLLADALGSHGRPKESSFVLAERTPVVQRQDYAVVIATLAPSAQRVTVKLAGPHAPHWAQASSFQR